jgi:phage baseplate assembly protein W
MTWLSDRVDELAEWLPVGVASPEEPVGWGSDLWCEDDLASDYREVSGSDPLVVAQAAYRAITTPRGSVLGCPDYGVDLRGYLSMGITTRTLAALRGVVELQIARDDRIAAVTVTATNRDPREIELRIDGKIESSTESFSLVVGLTDAGALLEEMRA